MRLEISREVLDGIVAEAAASPDVEICGLLLGEGMRVERVAQCRNVADEPSTSFEIDPQALIAAHKAARAGGPAVIGHYHSHPTGKAEPSARDAAAAIGGEIWLIVARMQAAVWMAQDDGHFTRLAIHASPAQAGAQ